MDDASHDLQPNLAQLNWNSYLFLALMPIAIILVLGWAAYELNGGGSDDPYVVKNSVGEAGHVAQQYNSLLKSASSRLDLPIEGSPSKSRKKGLLHRGRDNISGFGLVFRAKPTLKPSSSVLKHEPSFVNLQKSSSSRTQIRHEVIELTDTRQSCSVSDPLPPLPGTAVRPRSTLPLLRDSMGAPESVKPRRVLVRVHAPSLPHPSQARKPSTRVWKGKERQRVYQDREARLLEGAAPYGQSINDTNCFDDMQHATDRTDTHDEENTHHHRDVYDFDDRYDYNDAQDNYF